MINWKKEIFSIPNLLSLFRLLLIPVYAILYLRADHCSDYILAGAVMAFSCLTDMLDGKIARRFNMTTKLGIFLDPLADKLTQATIAVCLAIRYPILWVVFGLLLLKEGFMLVMGAIYLKKGKMLPGALMSGKVCTTILFVSMIAMVMFPQLSMTAIYWMVATASLGIIVALVDYARIYFTKDDILIDVKDD